MFLEKQRKLTIPEHLVHASIFFCRVRVAHLLLLLVLLHVLFWLFYVLMCVSVFNVGSLSLDYILLISVQILVPEEKIFERNNIKNSKKTSNKRLPEEPESLTWLIFAFQGQLI